MNIRTRARGAVISAAAFFLLSLPSLAWPSEEGSRDILWQTVSNCLDPTAFDYCGTCTIPLAEMNCANRTGCSNSLELWTESEHYVSFRDRKMCDCPGGFVHGLAVPRARVMGTEDPRRPNGIWSFAWDAARTRIAQEKEIALYVNPPSARTQDQLHVHLVRLRPDARQRFTSITVARIASLDDVWSAARNCATAQGLSDYGVLVTTHPDGGFLVVVDRKSPNKYAQSTCK
ncbi:CDP-diacylglycerol diphosphatase [Geomonas sp. RF6]|uniref:CDP-diacylglycerol diphosphatase n=1 Tax=Geomonas sp. RF6 TaxID=2897342 RepID=UPI001E4A1488|nr:CDP-diacylglycerol diphosphatase [Geomonas sp. RF6]UFS72601.1 CDP-diacylglycerol diphosphatase [Geomonas sp. RF6]